MWFLFLDFFFPWNTLHGKTCQTLPLVTRMAPRVNGILHNLEALSTICSITNQHVTCRNWTWVGRIQFSFSQLSRIDPVDIFISWLIKGKFYLYMKTLITELQVHPRLSLQNIQPKSGFIQKQLFSINFSETGHDRPN